MLGAFALSLLLMLAVLLLPFMYGIFEITAMSATAWLIVAGLALAPLVIMEIVKGDSGVDPQTLKLRMDWPA